jgi:cell division protein FtsI (penicillin-binding protein 3)
VLRLGNPHVRISWAVAAVLVLLVVLAGRLVQLQGLDASSYSVMAERQRLQTITLSAARGEITDRNGVPFAQTVEARDIYADPKFVTRPEEAAQRLSGVLLVPAATLQAKLEQHNRFVYLARGVSPEVGREVMALGLAGVYQLPTSKRVYPAGDLASNVVGFVGLDGTGLMGLEWSRDKLLRGIDGKRTFEGDLNGRPIPDGADTVTEPRPGSTLRLTLDRDIQWEAQQAIGEQVRRTGAMSGTVIVMNPRNGQVLALASSPTFDPNHPEKATADQLSDPAVSDVYEPGSVNKVITMSAALELGLVTPTSPFTIPPTYQVAGRTFHDAEVHGTEHLTLTGVLAQSSNIGTIQVAQRLGKDELYKFLRAYGFGATTGLGVPGESPGLLMPPDRWWGTTLPTVAFGQGVGVNAVQVASVYSTIANGGVRVAPTIIAGTIDDHGHLTPAPRPATRRVVSARVAQQMRDMLEAVTSNQGTAPAARIPGYRVAGKTGTAQRPDGKGGYSGYTASFVGFAPADKPQLVVEVVLQKPVRGHFGGDVAAPVFHDVMSFALQSLGIPPTGTTPPTARLTFG